jgi:glutaredoxin
MHRAVVYSKDGCHLCERAMSALIELSKTHSLEVRTFEITKDTKVFEKYYLSIPVVMLDGKIVFQASDIDAPDDIARKLSAIVSSL